MVVGSWRNGVLGGFVDVLYGVCNLAHGGRTVIQYNLLVVRQMLDLVEHKLWLCAFELGGRRYVCVIVLRTIDTVGIKALVAG